MWIIAIILSIFLSIFSTAVMSYISMATPIGPWIASTLVLIAMLVYKVLGQKDHVSEQLALVTVAGSVGGILATAMGFSFPTLYFLDPTTFNAWMNSPIYFCSVLAAFAFVAGWFGLWIANVVEHKFIVEEKLAFPIGQLVQKMIAAQNQVRKAWELMIGFVSTAVFCVMQDGLLGLKGFIPKSIALVPATTLSLGSRFQLMIPMIPFDIWPMLWAIGFVTGHVIAVPLAVGALSKIFVVDVINRQFFPDTKSMEFVLAFCSGMVLAGALQGLLDTPAILWNAVKKMFEGNSNKSAPGFLNTIKREYVIEAALVVVCLMAFLTYFKFSFIAQIYLILFAFVCTYQMALIGGKLGLAQLGRFATFVMVPAMFIFNLNSVQIVLISTFVELCGGVATDILFGRKIGSLAHISHRRLRSFQYLGLVVSSLTIGVVFWLLIKQFTLGSSDLLAIRAQARQLLIGVKAFDYYILIIGLLFGFFLKVVKMNPMLVLGGLLMPLNISVGLMLGGCATLLTKHKEEWYPFWSGVFASNSVWMLLKAIL